MMECHNLWKREDNMSKQLSWLSSVFYLFQIALNRCSSMSRYVEEQGLVIESLQTELQKLYRQHFFKTISLSGKLAPICSKVKKEYREEFYISTVEYYNYCLTACLYAKCCDLIGWILELGPSIHFRIDGRDRLYGFRSKLKHRIFGNMVDKLSREVVKCYLRLENCR